MRALFDIPYRAGGHDKHYIDVFLPDSNANGACIFFIHGGGWTNGGRSSWHAVMEHFCHLGYACTSAGYRLLPDWRYPAQIEDVRVAMAFVKSHASEYGFSPDRVAVWGSSAGGHLAAMLATIQSDDDLGYMPEMAIRDTRPNAVVCLCSVVSVFPSACPRLTETLHTFLGAHEHEDPDLYRQASPLYRLRGDEPPFMLIMGDADITTPLPMHEAMRDALAANGSYVEHHVLPGVSHGYGYGVTSEAQQETLARAEAFLAKVL